MSELSAEESMHVSYSIQYDDSDEIYASEDNLNIALPFATGVNRKVVKVRVAYDDSNEPQTALTEPIELDLSASLNYSQAQ